MTLDDIRNTSDNKLAGSIRILLAVLFVMTGVMKLLLAHARRSLVRPVAGREHPPPHSLTMDCALS